MTRDEIETYQRESNQRAGYDPEKAGGDSRGLVHPPATGDGSGHAPAGTADCHPYLNDILIVTG